MAGHALYAALLNACVLYPLAMTDALLMFSYGGVCCIGYTKNVMMVLGNGFGFCDQPAL